MTTSVTIHQLLKHVFAQRHVDAALKHFQEMVDEFQRSEWEEAIGKGGKFIEAVLKALYVHVGRPVPPARQFKAGNVIVDLERLPGGSHHDSVRLTIPRAGRFVYDIASNRGARHDPDEIDPNEMDANVVIGTSSWILAEMLRYATKGAMDEEQVRDVLSGLMQRKYPLIEEVEGRVYFHVNGLSARKVAVLSLRARHPKRMTKEELIGSIVRHGFSKSNAIAAISRLTGMVDVDEAESYRLLQPGLFEADQLLGSPKPKSKSRRP